MRRVHGELILRRVATRSGRRSVVGQAASDRGAPESRLKALHTRRCGRFSDPSLFAIDKSPKGEPLFEAAKELARISPFRYIVMGHTHLARNLPLDGGGRYLNSGTWADLMRVPDEVFADDPQVSAAALQQLSSQTWPIGGTIG